MLKNIVCSGVIAEHGGWTPMWAICESNNPRATSQRRYTTDSQKITASRNDSADTVVIHASACSQLKPVSLHPAAASLLTKL